MSSAVGPVTRRGLANEVADRVREAIFAGVYPAGTALKEADLAARLGISRGSVREGLGLLATEGLVVSEWHRGARVRTLTPQDVDELYTLRAALDVLAMRTAASNGADLSALDAVVEEMGRARTDTERVACDMKFHDAVYAAAGHRRLTEAWEAIRSQVHLFLLARIDGDERYREIVVPEHAELAAVLHSGDSDEAERLAEAHLRGSYAKLAEQRPGPVGP